MSDQDQSPGNARPEEGAPPPSEHLNIKVTDNNNEVFFKIKRSTQLKKLMDAFCDRQGKMPSTVRFLFDGVRVTATDTPDTVSSLSASICQQPPSLLWSTGCTDFLLSFELANLMLT